MSRPARPTALALAAAVLLGGCGGDDPDPTAFAARTDVVCRTLGVAVDDLHEHLVRSTASSETAGLASALSRYAVVVRRSARALASVPAPRADRRFRDAAVAGLRRHARAMRTAADGARRGRVAADLRRETAGGTLPVVPPTVLADAPDCRSRD